MQIRKRSSIKYQIIMLIFGITASTMVIGFGIFIFGSIYNYKKDLIAVSSLEAKLLGEFSIISLLFNDVERASLTFEKLKVVKNIKNAHIFDAEENLFASYKDISDINNLEYYMAQDKKFVDELLYISEPIYHEEEFQGTIFLEISTTELNEKIKSLILISSLLLVILLIISLLLAKWAQHYISTPILNLAKITEEISQKHDYSIKVEAKSNDEIGVLYDSFSNLMKKIIEKETERNKALQELQESETRFSLFMNMLPAIAFIKNDKKCIYSNKYMQEQIMGDNKNISEKLISIQNGHDPTKINNKESIIIDRNNNPRIFDIWSFPINTDNESQLIGGIAIDITQRKHSELKIQYYIKKLEYNNQELAEFNYVASHDLREPLRTITSYCALLKDDMGNKLSEDSSQDLNFIIDAAKRMDILIQDLLTLSRVGRTGLKKREVDLNECINTIIKDLHVKITENNGKIIFNNLPKIFADKTQITRVFQNLISNSLKFHHSEDPIITIRSLEEENEYKIIISDNGIGINQKYLEQIFAPFKRLHSRNKFEGTGIGLAICKKIIERHNGNISAFSEEGKGTKITFSIPKENG